MATLKMRFYSPSEFDDAMKPLYMEIPNCIKDRTIGDVHFPRNAVLRLKKPIYGL